MTKALEYIEIDIEYCDLEYGEGDCEAALGVTGEFKCFNCKATCQDRVNFTTRIVTLRFGFDTGYLPRDIPCFPSLTSVSFNPATINLGQNMGQRASLSLSFKDHKHNDTGDGFDKYWDERDYDPYKTGTFWGKFRARQPYLNGKNLRWVQGKLGQTLDEMEVDHFIIEAFDGPTDDGVYTITAKDPMKLMDNDRAQAPIMSNGFLLLDATNVQNFLILAPRRIGPEEYPESGIINVGGKEIMTFTRDGGIGNDENTMSLLHFDGSNGGTSDTDVNLGGAAKVWSFGGNAKLNTSNKVFGSASLELDGSGDFITTSDSNDFTMGGSDWCIDMHFDCRGLTGQSRVLAGHAASGLVPAQAAWTIGRWTNDKMYINMFVGSTVYQIMSTRSFTNLINPGWHFLKIFREDNVVYMEIDGVLEGSTAITGSINNSAGAISIGRAGGHAGDEWLGFVDEWRLSLGTARTEEPIQTRAYNTINFDRLNVVRAQYNTTAAAHTAEERVQICLRYNGVDPVDIIRDLWTGYATFPDEWIPIEEWRLESQLYLQRLYTALICEPTSVKKLTDEIIEQAAMAMWWDARNQKARLQILRAILTSAVQLDGDVVIEDSLTVKDQPEKRINQVWTYYGLNNPLRGIDDLDNYLTQAAAVDLQAQTDYGTPAIKIIKSRWIPNGGRSIADRVNRIQLGRFTTPPRRLSFQTFKYGPEQLRLGLGARMYNPAIQDSRGLPEILPFQITRFNPTRNSLNIEGEEMVFNVPDDFNDRFIFIDANIANVNLRALFDQIYPEPFPGITVNCIVAEGVTVYSNNTSIPAFDVGDWPVGVNVELELFGDIIGRGGQGGNGGTGFQVGFQGEKGGDGLYSRFPIDVYIRENARIAGGGSGGGGGGGGVTGNVLNPVNHTGGKGGNGAGLLVGVEFDVPMPGNSGGPNTGVGGSGGDLAQQGTSGTPGSLFGGTGVGGGGPGPAGRAIDGVSFITVVENDGAIIGAQVN